MTREPSMLQDSSGIFGNIFGIFSTTPSKGGFGGESQNGPKQISSQIIKC